MIGWERIAIRVPNVSCSEAMDIASEHGKDRWKALDPALFLPTFFLALIVRCAHG